MAKLTLALAAVLVLVSLGFYFPTGAETALIPIGIALVFAVLGWLAVSKPRWNMHLMHVSVLFALIAGVGLTFMLVPYVRGKPIDLPAAVAEQIIVVLLMLVYVIAAVGSFVKARAQRKGPGAVQTPHD